MKHQNVKLAKTIQSGVKLKGVQDETEIYVV